MTRDQEQHYAQHKEASLAQAASELRALYEPGGELTAFSTLDAEDWEMRDSESIADKAL
ncbi:MAG: hypothetical protein KIS85_07750 [Anaerolineales bacterium]|nr:hypothetical protein [Anaerolineales bacterium]